MQISKRRQKCINAAAAAFKDKDFKDDALAKVKKKITAEQHKKLEQAIEAGKTEREFLEMLEEWSSELVDVIMREANHQAAKQRWAEKISKVFNEKFIKPKGFKGTQGQLAGLMVNRYQNLMEDLFNINYSVSARAVHKIEDMQIKILDAVPGARKAFTAFMQNADEAAKVYKVSQDEILEAVYNGASIENKVGNAVAKALRLSLDEAYNYASKHVPTLKYRKNYLGGAHLNRRNVSKVSKEEFIEDMKQWLDLPTIRKKLGVVSDSDKEIDELLSEIYNSTILSGSGHKGKYVEDGMHYARFFEFAGAEGHINFLKKYVHKNNNALAGAYQSVRRQIHQATLYGTFGPKPGQVLDDLHDQVLGLLSKEQKATHLGRFDKIYRDTINALNLTAGRHLLDDTFWSEAAPVINKLVSVMLTPLAVMRNVFIDLAGVHAGLSIALNTGNKNQISGVAKWFSENMVAMATPKGRAATRKLMAVFASAKYVDRHNGLFATHHASQMIGEMGSVAKSKVGQAFQKYADKLGRFVGKYSGNEIMFNTSQALADFAYSAFLDSILHAGKKFEDLDLAFRKMLAEADIGAEEFKILQMAKRGKLDEFKENFFNMDNVLKLDDDAFKPIMRAGETADQARIRLYTSSSAFITKLSDDSIAKVLPSTNRRYTLGKQPGTPAYVFMQQITKFMPITEAQWFGLMRSVLRNGGNEPHDIHTFNFLTHLDKKNLAKLAVMYGVGGIASEWARDIMSNRTPRPLSPDFIGSSLFVSGFGGVYSYMLLDAYNFMSGKQRQMLSVPMASVVGDLGKPLVGGPGAKRAAARSLTRLTPLNMWYSRQLTNELIHRAIFEESFYSPTSLNFIEKRGQEPLFGY